MIYHLWTALTHNPGHRLKNPNELYSFSALFIINNCIFIAKLIYNAIKIKHDWIDKTYPYERLIGEDIPADVDPAKKETYLSDAEFEKKFGCDRQAFESSPSWKQVVLKKKLGLF